MEGDRHVELGGGVPDRIEVGMAQTASVRRECGHEDPANAFGAKVLELAHGIRRIAERDVSEWEETIPIPLGSLESPAVVRAAVRGGERRVFHTPLPDQAEGRKNHLLVEALGVEEGDSGLHIVERAVRHRCGIEFAEASALALLLTVAGPHSKELQRRMCLGTPGYTALDRDVDLAAVIAQRKLDAAIAEGGVDVANPQVERLRKMAVAVDDLRHRPSPAHLTPSRRSDSLDRVDSRCAALARFKEEPPWQRSTDSARRALTSSRPA